MVRKAGRHTSGAWEVNAGQLQVRRSDDGIVVPRADEIYGVAFEGKTNPRLPLLTPEKVPLGITLSRYPAALEVRLLSGANGNASTLSWEAVAVAEEGEVPVPDVMKRRADHIIIGSRW